MVLGSVESGHSYAVLATLRHLPSTPIVSSSLCPAPCPGAQVCGLTLTPASHMSGPGGTGVALCPVPYLCAPGVGVGQDFQQSADTAVMNSVIITGEEQREGHIL